MAATPPSDNVWIGDLPAELTKQDLDTIFGAYGTIVQSKVMAPKNPGQKASAMVRFATVEEATWIVDNLNGNLAEGLPEEPITVRYANQWNNSGGGGGNNWNQNDKWNNNGGGKSWGKSDSGKGGGKWNNNKGDTPYGDKGKGGGKGKGGKGSAPGSFDMIFKGAMGLFKQSLGSAMKIPDDQQVYIQNLPADTTDENLYKLFAPFGAIAPTGVKALRNEDGTCKGIGFVDFLAADSAQNAVAVLDKLATQDGGTIIVAIKKPGKGKGKGKGGDE